MIKTAKNIGLFLSLLMFMASVPVFAQNPAVSWSACQKDKDCVVIWGGCGDTAINRNYASMIKPSLACDAASRHVPGVSSQCLENICRLKFPDQTQ